MWRGRGGSGARGGGGTSILTVTGTCRWTGCDFAVINIGTGYLNRPNWLLAGYSVYHRVASRASQPTMFMTGPRSRHQRPRVRDATEFYECMMIHSRIESPSIPVQGMHMKVFSKVYCDRVYFLCAERFETGSGFEPPAARGIQMRVDCPPPPPPGVGCPHAAPPTCASTIDVIQFSALKMMIGQDWELELAWWLVINHDDPAHFLIIYNYIIIEQPRHNSLA